MSKLLIAGAGAIGQWLGAKLSDAGHEVDVLCRPAHVRALQQALTVTGKTRWQGTLNAASEVSDLRPPYDGIFVTCKAFDTARLARSLAPIVERDTLVVSLQNGLGNGEALRANLPKGIIGVAVTSNGVRMRGPGDLHHAGIGATRIGPLGPDDGQRLMQARIWLNDAGLEPSWHATMSGHVWLKAIINAGINPTAALAGCLNGHILEDPELRARAERLTSEAAAAAKALGIQLPADPLTAMHEVLEQTANNLCSMAQDLAAGRRTEIEAITGVIVRVAQDTGTPAPESRRMLTAIKALEP